MLFQTFFLRRRSSLATAFCRNPVCVAAVLRLVFSVGLSFALTPGPSYAAGDDARRREPVESTHQISVNEFPSSASIRLEADSPGSLARVSINFKNEGDEPLEVLSVETSCGCLRSSGETGTVVPPGHSGKIGVTMHLPLLCDKVRQSLMLRFVGGPERFVRIEVEAEVRPPLSLVDNYLRPGKDGSVQLVFKGSADLRPKSLQVRPVYGVASVNKIVQNRDGGFTVSLIAVNTMTGTDSSTERLQCEMKLGDEVETFELETYIQFPSTPSVFPQVVYAKDHAAKLIVRNFTGDPAKFRIATATEFDSTTVEIKAVKKLAGGYLLDLSFSNLNDLHDPILLILEHPGFEELPFQAVPTSPANH